MATDSLLTKLKNKIAYKIHNAVTDEDAEQYARSRERATVEGADVTSAPNGEDAPIDSNTDDAKGDPNSFSIKRMAANVWSNLVTIVTVGFLPMVAIILSVLVANEMIIYAPTIRLAFFIFTFLICYAFTPFLAALSAYYVGRVGYAYHINNMTDQPKVIGFPHIFAFLPLVVEKPVPEEEKSTIKDFFLSPFYYLGPKEEKEEKALLTSLMDTYYASLKESFPYYDNVKNIESFKENYDKVEQHIRHLHDPSMKPTNTVPNTVVNTVLTNTVKNVIANRVSKPNTVPSVISNTVLNALPKKNNITPVQTQFFAPQALTEAAPEPAPEPAPEAEPEPAPAPETETATETKEEPQEVKPSPLA